MAKKTHRNMYCDRCRNLTDHLKITLDEFIKMFQQADPPAEGKEAKMPPEVTPYWVMRHGKPYKCGKCATVRTVKLQNHDLAA